jgi:hypothetical protein
MRLRTHGGLSQSCKRPHPRTQCFTIERPRQRVATGRTIIRLPPRHDPKTLGPPARPLPSKSRSHPSRAPPTLASKRHNSSPRIRRSTTSRSGSDRPIYPDALRYHGAPCVPPDAHHYRTHRHPFLTSAAKHSDHSSTITFTGDTDSPHSALRCWPSISDWPGRATASGSAGPSSLDSGAASATRINSRAVFSATPSSRATSRKPSPRSRIDRNARPHCTRCSLRRCAACSRSTCCRSANHWSTASARSRAEKNVAKSSTLARVRRACSCWAAAAASRAARRAAFVIAAFPMNHTLRLPNALRRTRTQKSLPHSRSPTPHPAAHPAVNRHLGHPNFTASPNITPLALRSRNGNGGRVTHGPTIVSGPGDLE